jgi:hypothetical protein
MTEEKIPVITFEQLMTKHNLTAIDLLQTDTEGYDYKILKSIDFSRHQIKVVYFETEWMTQFELREIFKYLRGFNYKIFQSGIDHIAIKL